MRFCETAVAILDDVILFIQNLFQKTLKYIFIF